jgi:hypothetical protein
MNPTTSRALAGAALALAAAAAPAQQQSPAPQPRATARASASDDSYSMLPYTRHGYLGINLGQTEFDTACGAGGYACEDSKISGYFYTGGLFNDWVGAELGYLNSGKADRAGGLTRAEGVGASLVLRAPMGPFSAFVKGGGMYAQTRVSSGALSDVVAGKRRSWAPTYGGGLGYDLTPNHGVVVEWNRARLRFPGPDERRNVDTTSVGYVYRF